MSAVTNARGLPAKSIQHTNVTMAGLLTVQRVWAALRGKSRAVLVISGNFDNERFLRAGMSCLKNNWGT